MALSVTGTLKVVLREIPDTQEHNGMIEMTLQNEPRGLPKDVSLPSTPLELTCAGKQWRNACTKADQMRTGGTPALLIVEAHVGIQDGALIGVVKGIQVVEGKKTAAPTA